MRDSRSLIQHNNGFSLSLVHTPTTPHQKDMDLPDFAYIAILLSIYILKNGAAGYKTYTVEQDCSSGNLTLNLTESGPGSALLLHTTDRISYTMSGKCKILLQAPTLQHRIVAAVRQIGFRSQLGGICVDFIQIEQKPMCSPMFRLDEEHHFDSADNMMSIIHNISQNGIDNSTMTGYPGVKLTVTAVRIPGDDCPNTGDWFRCRNQFCIWSELKCDSHNNCGDRSDELNCDPSGGSQTTALIILAVIIILLLLIMCIATLLCSKNEAVRRFSHRLRSQTVSYVTKRFSR